MLLQIWLLCSSCLLFHIASASPLWCGLPNPTKGKGKAKSSSPPVAAENDSEVVWSPIHEKVEAIGAEALYVDRYHFSGELPMQPDNDANYKPYWSGLKEKKSDYEGNRLQSPSLKGSRRSKDPSSSSETKDKGKGKQ